MDVKNEEKPQESSDKKVTEDKPKEEAKPINEQPIKETKCSIICGEVNYII